MEKDYMFQNNEVKDINEPIKDYRTDYGKGLEPKIDPRTDFGKGISFYTCDGKEVATMEQVMRYNKMYYESMMIKTQDDIVEKSNGGFHR